MNQKVVEISAAAPAACGEIVAASPNLERSKSAEPPSNTVTRKRPPPISIIKDTSSIIRDSHVGTSKTPTSANFNINNKRPRSPENLFSSTSSQFKGEESDNKRKKANRIRWKEDSKLAEIRIFEKIDEEEEDEDDRLSRLSHKDEGKMLKKPRLLLEWYNPKPLVISQEYLERKVLSEEEEQGRPLLQEMVICVCPEEIDPDPEQFRFEEQAINGLEIQEDNQSNGYEMPPPERLGEEHRSLGNDNGYRFDRGQKNSDQGYQENSRRDSYGGDNGWGSRYTEAASNRYSTEEDQSTFYRGRAIDILPRKINRRPSSGRYRIRLRTLLSLKMPPILIIEGHRSMEQRETFLKMGMEETERARQIDLANFISKKDVHMERDASSLANETLAPMREMSHFQQSKVQLACASFDFSARDS